MPNRGDRYIIEIDGPYICKTGPDKSTEYFKVVGLNNVFVTMADLERLRRVEGDKEIRIGDEVEITTTGERFFITKIQPVEDVDVCWQRVFGINQNGETYITPVRYIKKTWNKNPTIEEMFG